MAQKWEHLGTPAIDDGSRHHQKSSDIFSGKFPQGLRVLVFDEDPQYLMIMEQHLQEFQYEVTKCNDEKRALYLLRNHTNMFDVAIIEVNKSDGERFRLISEIGSEMDLPIITISNDDSVESVINWMWSGARDYLIKPLRPEDLRLVFKHVAKKKQRSSLMAVAVAGEVEKKAEEGTEKLSYVGDSSIKNPNKRKRSLSSDGQVDQEDRDGISSSKKRRVVWDDGLCKKFNEAMDYLGIENAVPKKILEYMNVEGLTRENVASHLQKYRQHQKRQNGQKERDEKKITLIVPQERKLSGGEEAMDFHKGRNVHYTTHQINNIPQPSFVQEHSSNANLTTHLISPPEHHHHEISIAVSGRNVVMTHHQTSGFTYIENDEEVYNNKFALLHNEDEIGLENFWFAQSSEQVGLFNCHEPMMVATATNTMIPNDHHLSTSLEISQPMNVHETYEPSILRLPSFPSYTDSSFLDQKETITMVDVSGGFNNINRDSVSSKMCQDHDQS